MFIVFVNKKVGVPAFRPNLSVGLNSGTYTKYLVQVCCK